MEERLTYRPADSPLFSHDGIHDSQTHLSAPPFFYEQLRRQVALSKRTQLSFSLIRIIFDRKLENGENGRVCAQDILHFSCELRTLTRTEECIGRLGVNECVILIGEGGDSAQRLFSRLLSSPILRVNDSLRISLAMVTSLPDEVALELLNRLDHVALSTH